MYFGVYITQEHKNNCVSLYEKFEIGKTIIRIGLKSFQYMISNN